MSFEVIIGIEIHCELKTRTKMFSGAPLSFGEAPNTCVNEVDLGHPGVLPCLNEQGVAYALKACMAMDCTIDPLVKFDRKNYYYSDLPKGFQITQQFHPIGRDGKVEIEVDGVKKMVRINRIHMEEDTAKQIHDDHGTFIDFNRAGTPLIEIVTEADLRSGKEAAAYVEKLRLMLYYLGISDVKMEEGSMRCDVNISLRPHGVDYFGVKTEIKNLNSISNVQKAIESEIERQSKIILQGGIIEQATRRYDEATRSTILMRKKEGTVDYKYFPEPNIPPVRLSEAYLANVKASMPELPHERKQRYLDVYGLSDYDASVLVANKEMSDFYDEVVRTSDAYKLAANWTITEVSAMLNKLGITLQDSKLQAKELASMIEMIKTQEISGKQAKVVFEELFTGASAAAVVEAKGMKQNSDAGAILALINQVLDANPQSIEDYKNGRDRAVGFLVGQVMKASKGQANPAMTNKLIVEELNKR
ncbi:MAG: Asp-tRNA(Asn)/Glu-tRNA(Gln) amidotransferase subunit GatB [Erysipelotrichaceae bacterium]